MTVHCAACGEELLGAVNRCWRCGRTFRYAPTPESEPPVRRSPLTSLTPDTSSPPLPINATASVAQGVLLTGADADAAAAVAIVAAPSEPEAAVGTPDAVVGELPRSGTETQEAAKSLAVTELDRPTLNAPPEGRLIQVDLSSAVHLGSPFQDEFRIRWADRCRLWFRVPREWWSQLRRRRFLPSPSDSDSKTPSDAKPAPASLATANPITRTTSASRTSSPTIPPTISPVRAAWANASLVLSVVLGFSACALLVYPLIAILIAGIGLGLAVASLVARVRWRVLVAVFICLIPLATLTTREILAWRAAQAQARADLWEE